MLDWFLPFSTSFMNNLEKLITHFKSSRNAFSLISHRVHTTIRVECRAWDFLSLHSCI